MGLTLIKQKEAVLWELKKKKRKKVISILSGFYLDVSILSIP